MYFAIEQYQKSNIQSKFLNKTQDIHKVFKYISVYKSE